MKIVLTAISVELAKHFTTGNTLVNGWNIKTAEPITMHAA